MNIKRKSIFYGFIFYFIILNLFIGVALANSNSLHISADDDGDGIDDDIEEGINKKSEDFGIVQGNIYKIIKNIEKGIHPHKIFEEGLKGKDLGITVPVKGKASTSENTFNYLQKTFASKQKKLNEKFEKMATENGLYSSYD